MFANSRGWTPARVVVDQHSEAVAMAYNVSSRDSGHVRLKTRVGMACQVKYVYVDTFAKVFLVKGVDRRAPGMRVIKGNY